MSAIEDVRPLVTAELDHANGGSLPLAVAAGGFLAACIARLQAILTDMGRTWTRLALEAEQTLKESRPPLQLIVPNPASPDPD